MKSSLSKSFLSFLLIYFIIINQVQGWIKCYSGEVSLNLELTFQTKDDNVNATVKDLDIKVYETQIFGTYIYSIYSLTSTKNTPFDWLIETTGPTTPLYGFSVFGEVSYKINCTHHRFRHHLCDKTMKFGIPDACLDCYGNPKLCTGAVDLQQEKSWIRTSPDRNGVPPV
uniref:Uncharacterized protein n=1 Tax=Parastrongyloides trichosuri TaxID=131310 RepID=A0A0N5A103_PARTI